MEKVYVLFMTNDEGHEIFLGVTKTLQEAKFTGWRRSKQEWQETIDSFGDKEWQTPNRKFFIKECEL